MEFKKGYRRIVILVGPLALKFARVRLLYWARSLFTKGPSYSFKLLVLEGLIENSREAGMWFSTRHRLVTPIFLPLIFANVAKREQGVGILPPPPDMFEAIRRGARHLPEWKDFKEMLPWHTIHPDNISFWNGQVRFVDCGERGFRRFVLKYGDLIEEILLSIAEKQKQKGVTNVLRIR